MCALIFVALPEFELYTMKVVVSPVTIVTHQQVAQRTVLIRV